MAFPAVLIARSGGRRPSVAASTSLFRSVVVSVESGLLAGVLAAGLGARLFMRIAAAVSPDSAQGVRTAAEETVGEINVGGTLFLVLIIGLFGGPAMGLLYRVVRKFLPLPASLVGIAVVALPAALLGRAVDFTNPKSVDFEILGPKPVIAVVILGYIAFAGAALGATHEWLERTLPAPSRQPRAIAAYAPAAAALISPVGILAVLVGAMLVGFAERNPVATAVARRLVGALSVIAALVVLGDLVRIAA
jgi:hypothetical protein